jgi:hypothetical protein
VTIPKIPNTNTGKYAIDSHVLGCHVTGTSNDCSTTAPLGQTSQAAFVDQNQPLFVPSGTTTFTSARMSSTATCADVRQQLP